MPSVSMQAIADIYDVENNGDWVINTKWKEMIKKQKNISSECNELETIRFTFEKIMNMYLYKIEEPIVYSVTGQCEMYTQLFIIIIFDWNKTHGYTLHRHTTSIDSND